MLRSNASAWLGLISLCAGIALACGGCGISPFFPPSGVGHIRFSYEHSPRVTVEKAWFERPRSGQLQLAGYVSATTEGVTTTQTRLEVTLRDMQGTVLQTSAVTFEPRQIPPRVQMRGGTSNFTLPMPSLPPGTARVTVSARDT